MEKLNIDAKIHEDIGMTVVTKEDVVGRKRLRPTIEIWPKDNLFNPCGISMEEAEEAMRKML